MLKKMRRVSTILTTTHAVAANGGVRLDKAVLDQLADGVRSGSIPMMFNHDVRQQTTVANVESGVRLRPDGEWEAWAEFDVDADDWDRFERQLKEAGAPGGMSFKASEPFIVSEGGPPAIHVCADAHHFPDELLLDLAKDLSKRGPFQIDHLYSFSFVPPAAVVIAVAAQWASQIPPNLLASWLYDAAKRFLQPIGAEKTIFDFEINHTDGSQVKAHLETANKKTLRRAIEAFRELSPKPRTYEYDDDHGWRELGG